MAAVAIVYSLPNVGYLLIIASMLGMSGFYHKLNILAMFSHLFMVSLAFEYVYLSNDLIESEKTPISSALYYTLLVYCPLHLVLAVNRLLFFYHYMRKQMRRKKRRELRRKDSSKRKSRPVSIMQLKEDVNEYEEDEEDYDLWKSWQNFFVRKSTAQDLENQNKPQ